MQAPVLCVLLLVGLLTGCRTYGGYGSEEAAIEEMAQAVDNYEDMLVRAEAVLAGLREAEGENVEMGLLAERFAAVVTGHAVLLEEQKEYVAVLAGSGDYRKISRVLGAVISEQKMTARQYTEVLERGLTAPDTTAQLVRASIDPLGRYYVIPPYYERVRRAPLGAMPRFEIGIQPNTEQ